MRVLMVSKYPPIEGGVSAGDYWLARGLGESDVSVTVVTNALCVEDFYRISIDLSDPNIAQEWAPKNVRVRSLHRNMPAHIPYSPAYTTRLVNSVLSEMGEKTFDALYARYLEPYGTAALLVKTLTNMPYVLRHAGSDIYRLLPDQDLRYALGRVISNANKIILSPRLRHLAPDFGVAEDQLVNTQRSLHPLFSPEGPDFDFLQLDVAVPPGVPVILYLGKSTAHKGLFEIIDALAKVSLDFRCIMVTQGPLESDLRRHIIDRGMGEKIFIRRFVPPWDVPALLRSASALLHLEHNFPIPIHGPSQPHEAIACATPLILSREMYEKLQSSYPEEEAFTIVEDPKDISGLRAALVDVIEHAEKKKEIAIALEPRRGLVSWKEYIQNYITLFRQLSQMKK